MKRFTAATLTLAAVIVVGVLLWWSSHARKRSAILDLLRTHQLSEARAALNDYDDWSPLLREIEVSRDFPLVQAAFDVQFEYWYSRDEDSNVSYPEYPQVLARLLTLGATARFTHLLRATQQNKSEAAWLFLRAGVPVSEAGAADTPLANAAYWGDLNLVSELLRRGADPNQPSAKDWRPVLAAAWACRADCVRLLLDHGADVTLPYEEWEGHTQPIWKVVKERAGSGADATSVWHIVRERVPASERDAS